MTDMSTRQNPLEAEPPLKIAAESDPRLRADVAEMRKTLAEVKEKMPKKPGLLSRLWSKWYIRYPVIAGALIAGGYYAWPYLKQFINYLKGLLEQHNKDIAAKALKAREALGKSRLPLGGTTVIDEYTSKVTSGTSGAGRVGDSRLGRDILGAPADKLLEESIKKSIDDGTPREPLRP